VCPLAFLHLVSADSKIVVMSRSMLWRIFSSFAVHFLVRSQRLTRVAMRAMMFSDWKASRTKSTYFSAALMSVDQRLREAGCVGSCREWD
jgi:hypothetical protein